MNALDFILIASAVVAGAAGYRAGFLSVSTSLVGALVGALVGVWVAPYAVGESTVTLFTASIVFALMFLAMFTGQALAQWLAARYADKLEGVRAHVGNAVGGAVVGSFSLLLAATVVGSVLSGARIDPVAPLVQSSAVVKTVESTRVLDSAGSLFGAGSFMPRYLAPFIPEQVVETSAPDDGAVTSAAVVAAQSSTVKVNGIESCAGNVTGTGFLFAPGRVMTNAHVVAGTTASTVTIGDQTVPATVVAFDSELDVAVLAVETDAVHLDFAADVEAGQDAAVIGFPGGGDLDVQPARVRERKHYRSPNSSGTDTVVREVLALRGVIRHGNSGGPVVNADGEVLGVVFATSLTHEETGYALTVDQVAEVAAKGTSNDKPVKTGTCGN